MGAGANVRCVMKGSRRKGTHVHISRRSTSNSTTSPYALPRGHKNTRLNMPLVGRSCKRESESLKHKRDTIISKKEQRQAHLWMPNTCTDTHKPTERQQQVRGWATQEVDQCPRAGGRWVCAVMHAEQDSTVCSGGLLTTPSDAKPQHNHVYSPHHQNSRQHRQGNMTTTQVGCGLQSCRQHATQSIKHPAAATTGSHTAQTTVDRGSTECIRVGRTGAANQNRQTVSNGSYLHYRSRCAPKHCRR